MSTEEKLVMLKTFLGNPEGEDDLLTAYLEMAETEILNWLYIRSEVPEDATFPTKYDMVHVQACVAGFNLQGAENQGSHSENGISRTFRYSDMVGYIHGHVQPFVGVI